MTSDGQTAKIKVIDLDKFYNFYVHDFLVEIIKCSKMTFEVSIFWNSKFKYIKHGTWKDG